MFDLTAEQQDRIRCIKLLILDVDGVLTDGRLFFDDQGNEFKFFHARDGLGLKMLRQSGVELAVISGRRSNSVLLRMQSLGIKHVYQGYDDKRLALAEILENLQLSAEQVAYAGDDLIDLPVMTRVGFAIAVNDANFAVKRYAAWVTQTCGGHGAVREICDMIMQVQGSFEACLKDYL